MIGLSWLNPARWLILGALVAAVVGGITLWGNMKVKQGRNEIQAEWTAEKLAVSEASRQREKALSIATEGLSHAYEAEQTRRAASERVNADRLRRYQTAAASAGGGVSSGPGGIDAAYRAIALECGQALGVLDNYAQRVASQARALQDYARLCVGAPSP